jgi:hypothetical protein
VSIITNNTIYFVDIAIDDGYAYPKALKPLPLTDVSEATLSDSFWVY